MDRLFPDPFSSAAVNDAHDSRARDSLLLLARLRFDGAAEPVDVRVRNLSAGGLMAEVATAFDRGTPVEVELRGLGWVSGKIAWCAEGRTGIAFDQLIDPRRARKPVSGARGPAEGRGK